MAFPQGGDEIRKYLTREWLKIQENFTKGSDEPRKNLYGGEDNFKKN